MLDSEIQRCAGCKHWDTAFDEFDGPPAVYLRDSGEHGGLGTAVPLPGEWGDCQRIMHRQDEYAEHQPGPDDLAFLSDGSGYFASITTRAEFGCVLWEAGDA